MSGCQDWRDRLTDLAQSADTLGRGPFTLCRATFTEQTAAEALSTQSGVPWSLAPASAGVEGSAEAGRDREHRHPTGASASPVHETGDPTKAEVTCQPPSPARQ